MTVSQRVNGAALNLLLLLGAIAFAALTVGPLITALMGSLRP